MLGTKNKNWQAMSLPILQKWPMIVPLCPGPINDIGTVTPQDHQSPWGGQIASGPGGAQAGLKLSLAI